jgi:hypothetical protein
VAGCINGGYAALKDDFRNDVRQLQISRELFAAGGLGLF